MGVQPSSALVEERAGGSIAVILRGMQGIVLEVRDTLELYQIFFFSNFFSVIFV